MAAQIRDVSRAGVVNDILEVIKCASSDAPPKIVDSLVASMSSCAWYQGFFCLLMIALTKGDTFWQALSSSHF